MYVGKKNLLDAIKLLADPKVATVDGVDLILSNGQTIPAIEILVDGQQVCARDKSGKWIMLPDEELIGISVAFGVMPKGGAETMPQLLNLMRERRKLVA